MDARAALALVLVGACYEAPAPPDPCAIRCLEDCPGELSCVNGFCVADGEVCMPTFQRVSAGAGYGCALDDTGGLWCWGSNAHHQIDPGDRAVFELPARVGTASWDDISTGGHICGISAGRLSCWGAND